MDFPSHLIAVLDQIPALRPELGESVRDWVEAISPLEWTGLAAVSVLGFLLGCLFTRSRSRRKVETPGAQGVAELMWRHEKLVLLERQESERRERRAELTKAFRISGASLPAQLKWELSELAEEGRGLRQQVGTDCSRMELLRVRLTELASRTPSRPEAIRTCLERVESQLVRLESARDHLRPVSQSLIALAEEFQPAAPFESADRDCWKGKLNEVIRSLEELPMDWKALTEQADREIRDVLRAGGEPEHAPLCDILLVDGGSTPSLNLGGEVSLRERIGDLIDLLEESGSESLVALLPNDSLVPSSSFAPAGSGNPRNGTNGSHGIASVPRPDDGSLILFRSNDVSIWGKTIYRGTNHRARSLNVIPDWAEWISIQRTDTGETVYASIHGFSLSNSETLGPVGFNGTHELFYGARHLGMFSDACPNEIETRFTYGGWGFGHRVSQIEEAGAQLQASGWGGREISSDTVFEIAIHEELPELVEGDELLQVPNSTRLAMMSHS